jgi:hypothetical protein
VRDTPGSLQTAKRPIFRFMMREMTEAVESISGTYFLQLSQVGA